VGNPWPMDYLSSVVQKNLDQNQSSMQTPRGGRQKQSSDSQPLWGSYTPLGRTGQLGSLGLIKEQTFNTSSAARGASMKIIWLKKSGGKPSQSLKAQPVSRK